MGPSRSSRRSPPITPTAANHRKRARLAPCSVAAWLLTAAFSVQASPAPAWTGRLHDELSRIDGQNRADIGVYVRDLDTGAALSFRADQTWYLASTVKLPIAIAVLRGVERGDHTLATLLPLAASDYVDGAGQTNSHAPGSLLSVRYLLEQMMVYSDNTASDLLIGLVGLRSVNAVVQSLAAPGFEAPGFAPITRLADVRRHIYGELTPAATRLAGKDFLLLKQQRSDAGKRMMLARLLHMPVSEFHLASVAQAYDAYYATGLNSGRLDAYGELLAQLSDGRALGPEQTTWLLALMERSQTGQRRVRAGLPASVRFAHKTGTQSARTCDSGVLTVPRMGRDQRVVVAACTRGEASVAAADRALKQVGSALCRSGLFSNTTPHGTYCPADPTPVRLLPGPGGAAAEP